MISKNSSGRGKNLKPSPKRTRFVASTAALAVSSESSLPSPLQSEIANRRSDAAPKDRRPTHAQDAANAAPEDRRPTVSRLGLRPYQKEAFEDRTHGIECWLWGRQTGKSYTLAAWAIDRLVTKPGRLVTILSNSLANGRELNQKCADIARLYDYEFAQDGIRIGQFETMNVEIRVTVPSETGAKVSRIKILPANPRTARGFSGDLILDEFAFHENGTAIWEAAEPILAANRDYLCRIASTPNGRHNMFYRLATDPRIPTRIVPRSLAWEQELIIAHPITRKPITPAEARALAVDKRAYDQNYECIFEAENMSLLTRDLISQAEDDNIGVVCDDTWSHEALALLRATNGGEDEDLTEDNEGSEGPGMGLSELVPPPIVPPHIVRSSKLSAQRNYYVGVDVGRTHDITVISVVEKTADRVLVRAILRLRNVRLPQQQQFLEVACRSPRFAAAQIDMTGLGLGLFEYTHQRFGDRIRGLNFASSIPLLSLQIRNQKSEIKNIRVPEALALGLLQLYEGKRIRHPIDTQLREDLRKPERITTADGRVSITASRDENGHADHFWSLALAVDAAQRSPAPQIYVPRLRNRMRIPRNQFA